jgi:tellurite resistance protein
MTPSANSNIAAAFSEDLLIVLDNEHQFKIKLKIDEKANKYTSLARKTADLSEATAIGVGTAVITNTVWYSSLGVLGKAAVAIGISSTPVGWIAAAGVVATVGVIGTKKVIKNLEKSTTHMIPKNIDESIDSVALCVSNLLLPPAVQIACSDNDFCTKEYNHIVDYFVNEFGYNKNFVIEQIAYIENNLKHIDYRALRNSIESACNSNKDLHKDQIINEIIQILQEVSQADGKSDPNENDELKKARTFLLNK